MENGEKVKNNIEQYLATQEFSRLKIRGNGRVESGK